ncbi:lovastatin nonaketide synthase [Aspergillus steynii IBT 23096]|uniref:Lovastatin nonaketide synthase n=1 Tax=Aspergillus steynii IBT 23096 TaxID=1392250 RepID=A0A2I2GKN8_9EURO|nr:lovastatin nonaketide synthase [Aspergillus steynii IBT 23096]PLB53452.1 lovastatin nonaketide synthase [Aspergillus steynii IBT 23096]
MDERGNEPIVIIGSGCRFPGGASSPSLLWELLRKPRDCLTEIPKDRFNWEGYHFPDTARHGSTITKYTHFLQEDIRKFDTQFFNMQPAEADAIDPQQRILLETVYEGLELAGLTIEGLQGSSTAVYVGMMGCDYADVVQGDIECTPKYAGTSTSRSIHSNRISYFFDWHGPSMTIDTACSSSMMAIHLAVQLLRSGESNVAVACGTNLIITPQNFVVLSNLNMISPDGRAKMWDESADGYARGEGVGAIILKTLSAAEADGDTIECVIRETGVNQDGRTRGITMPSSAAQADLIRKTYARAGLDLTKPEDRPQYFEAHGTGTKVGDPQEAEAVFNAFFGDDSNASEEDNLHIGSVKTIIGHTEGAAGLAGVLKASLAIKNGYIPPNMLFNSLNPALEPFAKKLRLATELTPWPVLPTGAPRRASVNSFGFGGSNGHAILEGYNARATEQRDQEKPVLATPFLFSAQSERALSSTLRQFSDYLNPRFDADLRDIAWTLQYKRSTFGVRTAITALNRDDLLSQLSERLNPTENQIGVKNSLKRDARILGIFTGQGAQWAGMGQVLLRVSPKAREIVRSLDDALATLPRENDRPSWKLEEELMKDREHSRVGVAAISQPLCTVVQILLVDMLHSAGVRFHSVAGHSSGEIGAAYAANLITAQDAIRIAYYRGLYAYLAAGQEGQKGAMMAVGMSLEEARELCDDSRFRQRLFVAACNSGASVTLSGDHDSVAEAKVLLDESKKFARVLKVDTAYHSHHMLPCAQPYLDALASCNIRLECRSEDSPAWLSSVYPGKSMSDSPEISGAYWVANMTQPVLFAGALETAFETQGPFDIGLEVGPHPALRSPVLQTIQDLGAGNKLPYAGTMMREKNDIEAFSEALGLLWTYSDRTIVNSFRYGQTFFPNPTEMPVFVKDLPTYPWDHERSYWFDARSSRALRNRPGPVHSLLGTTYGDSADEIKWRNFLIPKEVPWLGDHRLQGRAVLPAAAYVMMVCEAVLLQAQGQDVQLIELFDLSIHRAISFDDETSAVEVILTLSNVDRTSKSTDKFTADWTIRSPANKEADKARVVSSGSVSVLFGPSNASTLPGRGDPRPNQVNIDVQEFYSSLAELGYGYTGAFLSMTSLQRKLDHSSGTFAPPSCDLVIHPALLDMAFQALFAAVGYPGDGGLWSLHVPTGIGAIRINPHHFLGRTDVAGDMPFDATLARTTERTYVGDVSIYSPSGHGFLQIENVTSVPFTGATIADDRNIFSEEIWAFSGPDGSSVVTQELATSDEQQYARDCERAVFYYFKKLVAEISASEVHGAAPHHQRLLEFASHFVSEVISGKRPQCKPEWANDGESDILAVLKQYPDNIDLKLINSVGEAYPSIIRGETDQLEHLIKDDMLARLWAEGLGIEEANTWAARLIKQISHRYPHMNIIEIGTGTSGATEAILGSLGSAFKSYTSTDSSTSLFEKAKERFSTVSHKMVFRPFDIEKASSDQGFEPHTYDLVVASNVTHSTKDPVQALQNIRSLLRPGGYLVLVEMTEQVASRIGFILGGLPGRSQGEGNHKKLLPALSTAEWHRILKATGYSGIDTIAMSKESLAHPFSVSVTEAMDDHVAFLRNPLFVKPIGYGGPDDLLIIGTSTLESARLATNVSSILSQHFTANVIETLEEIPDELPTTVLVLTELCNPMFQDMTLAKLQAVKHLLRDNRNVVWVTRGSKCAEPYSNMVVGLGRSASNEQKELRLQFLDVDEGCTLDAGRLCEMLLTLRTTQVWEREGTMEQILWTTEPEYRLEADHLLIPRMYQHQAQNERYNSKQRHITQELPTGTNTVSIIHDVSSKTYRLVSDSNIRNVSVPESISIRVVCSLLSSLKLAGGLYLFPVVGRRIDSDEVVVALSTSNASIVDIPKQYVVPFKMKAGNERHLLIWAVWELLVQSILSKAPTDGGILVLGVKERLLELLCTRASQQGKTVFRITDDPLSNAPSSIFVHPMEFQKSLKAKLPSTISAFVDLSEDLAQGNLHKRLVASLPAFCEVVTTATLFSSTSSSAYSEVPPEASLQALISGVSVDTESAFDGNKLDADNYSLPLRQVPTLSAADPFLIVDWAAETHAPVDIQPVDYGIQFSKDKTYLLVGLTGDLGQSLCEWFVQHGARHLVLTSRKPKISQSWLDSMKAAGANVTICAMDITSKASRFPPIAGVANAAMVMQDIMLSNMELEDMLPVLKPKVDGSRYLDDVFRDHELDFFILFSSVGFAIGNSGQSNYVAANAFMASLAAQRRQRGLAASVMHIGAIIGAGYITRGGHITSADLNAYGAYPLSTSDFHQLFGEAVLASPANSGRNPDIVSGLRTIDPVVDDRVLWRANPRFSHFWRGDEELKTAKDAKRTVVSVKAQLAEATSKDQARDILQECFSARVVLLLQLHADDMDDNAPLIELGVDSLVAVEARSWFTKQLNVDISVLRILGGACVVDLVADALERLSPDLLPRLKSTEDEKLSKSRERMVGKGSEKILAPVKNAPSGNSSAESVDASSSAGSVVETPSTAGSEVDESDADFKPVLLRSEPMSYAQSRFWFLRHSVEDKTAFNITFSHSLKGDAHPVELVKAVQEAVRVHEGLRTCFFEQDNVPMQGILQASPLYLERRVIQSEDEANAEYDRLAQHVYNLEDGQTMRLVLLEQSSQLSYLIVGYHHIAMDGAGFTGFLEEILRIGGGEKVPKPIQYADYSRQLRNEVQSGSLDSQLSYWRAQLSEIPSVLPLLPFSKVQTRAPLRSYASSTTSVRLDSTLVARIKRRSRNFQSTAFHFYLTVFKTLLFQLTDAEDLCIGIADSNRSDAELQRTMGILVNILPLKFKSQMSMTFGDAVKEARKTSYGALENSRIPFNVLLDTLPIERSSSHFPIFQAFLDYRPGIQERWTLRDVEVQRLNWSYGRNPYDINLDIMENTSGTAFITMNAQEYLYGQAEVETLMKAFINLLEAFSRNPALHLNEPAVFSELTIQTGLDLGRGPDLSSDWPPTLSQRVQEIAKIREDNFAVKDRNGNKLTYRELMQEMQNIANALAEVGITPGDRVALFQRPTITAIPSILAIMQIGAVYVPLDLRSPAPRLAAIVRDCQPRAVLYHPATEAQVREVVSDDVKLVNTSTIPRTESILVPNVSRPEAEAVILYTSGSTGTPKGVILLHSAIRNAVEGLTKRFNIGAEVVLQQSALTFDLSLHQTFTALANGGTLHIIDQAKMDNAVDIPRLIQEENITYTMATPSEYSYWCRFGAVHLERANNWKFALSLGEELKSNLVQEFKSLNIPNLRLINTYGPAEITIHSHAVEIPYQEATNDSREVIPVGHSLPNYSVYVMDESLKPVPVGMPGQICIGGAGLSQGYVNLPGLSQEQFVPNPFATADWVKNGWDRMYLTGDRGRLREDGALLFGGRMSGSTQIKLRGLRIELGEVEHAILKAASPALNEVVVSVRGDPELLVAHVVFSRDHGIEDGAVYLNQVLGRLPLPEYMVPAMIVPLDRMPLTTHNKVDRKAIAAIPLPANPGSLEHASELTSLETELVHIWQVVLSNDSLHLDSIPPETSFFRVGGNSLLLIPLQYMIKDTFYSSLSMVDFAESHTVRKMASRIEQAMSKTDINWTAETALVETSPTLRDEANPARRTGTDLRVLYTGATGHSARFVLQKLVEDRRISKIYCVAVRSTEKNPAPRPLAITSDKIVQFPGNLIDDRLGLSEDQLQFLTEEVDVIIHSAANRSFWDNYQVMKQVNVLPVHTLIPLAIPRKVPIHFMSSAAVHLFDGRDDENYPETRATHTPPADGKHGYLATKWAAEKILENASSMYGLPVYIHRPAPVGQQPERLSKAVVFSEFMRFAQALRLNIPRNSIRGTIDLLDVARLAGALLDSMIGSTEERDGPDLVRYIHHYADMKLHLDEWQAYVDEHVEELEIDESETHNATEWIAKAKEIGFPYLLAAQNFDLTGESALPITQRR